LKNSWSLKFIQTLFLFLIFSTLLFPQLDSSKLNHYNFVADQIIKKTLTEKTGYKLLQELCEIGPRLSGSENSLQAIYWAEAKLKKIGVDKVWLQPVMVPHWERGNGETAVIVNNKSSHQKPLNILSLGGSVPTPENGITANVIEIKNFSELEQRLSESANIDHRRLALRRNCPNAANGQNL
jgi:carboxypeptidase Q